MDLIDVSRYTSFMVGLLLSSLLTLTKVEQDPAGVSKLQAIWNCLLVKIKRSKDITGKNLGSNSCIHSKESLLWVLWPVDQSSIEVRYLFKETNSSQNFKPNRHRKPLKTWNSCIRNLDVIMRLTQIPTFVGQEVVKNPKSDQCRAHFCKLDVRQHEWKWFEIEFVNIKNLLSPSMLRSLGLVVLMWFFLAFFEMPFNALRTLGPYGVLGVWVADARFSTS